MKYFDAAGKHSLSLYSEVSNLLIVNEIIIRVGDLRGFDTVLIFIDVDDIEGIVHGEII